MEPISLAASCLSLIAGIGALSKTLAELVTQVRESRRDVDAIRREISSLSLCIENLQTDVETPGVEYPDHLQRSLKDVLDESNVVITQIADEARKITTGGPGGKLRWIMTGKDEMDKLKSRLESHKATLDLSLDLIAIINLQSVKEDTTAIKDDTGIIRHNTGDIQEQIHGLVTEFQSLKTAISGSHAKQNTGGGGNFILEKFLDESTAYAQTVIGDESESDTEQTAIERPSKPAVRHLPLKKQSGLLKYIDENAEDETASHASDFRVPPSEYLQSQSEVISTSQQFSLGSSVSLAGNHLLYEAQLARNKLSRAMRRNLDASFTELFLKRHDDKHDPDISRLEELLQSGADVNCPLCVEKRIDDTWSDTFRIQTLAKGTAASSFRGLCRAYTPLAAAIIVWPDKLDVIELLIDYGADINAKKVSDWEYDLKYLEFEYPLHAAVAMEARHVVELLLEKGADPSSQGGIYGTALACAASRGHMKIAELLIENGADVNAQAGLFGTALIAASYCCRLPFVRLLVDAGANVNTEAGIYGFALHAVAGNGGHDAENVVRFLLDRGADVNAIGGHFYTALIAAVHHPFYQYANLSIIRLLIARGADIDKINPAKGAAVHTAMRYLRRDEFIDLLIAGAKYHAQAWVDSYGGVSVMMMAIKHQTSQKEAMDIIKDSKFTFADKADYQYHRQFALKEGAPEEILDTIDSFYGTNMQRKLYISSRKKGENWLSKIVKFNLLFEPPLRGRYQCPTIDFNSQKLAHSQGPAQTGIHVPVSTHQFHAGRKVSTSNLQEPLLALKVLRQAWDEDASQDYRYYNDDLLGWKGAER